ncbi:MAG: conserved repeat domain protein [Acidobacteria bacterium]|nr:conserved repeat domain protein [Acidobacteriota bacterium]
MLQGPSGKRQMRYFSICVVTCIAILICSSNPSYAKDVTLAWDANTEADLAGYKIYYEPGASGGQNLASYPGTGAAEGSSPIGMQPTADENPEPGIVQFSLHGLDEATTYCFVVTACNAENLESASSREVFVFGSGDVSAPYNAGWGISAGDLKGFIVLYNSLTDPGVIPTLGPSEDIPSLTLPDLQAVGTPLNLQPSSAVFKQPVWVEFPCPGYSDMSQISLALYDDSLWMQVWDGSTGMLTAAGEGWLDGKPQYNASEDPQTIVILVKHFTGVQAAVSGQSIAPSVSGGSVSVRGVSTGSGGGGGGGGCFISAMLEKGRRRQNEKYQSPSVKQCSSNSKKPFKRSPAGASLSSNEEIQKQRFPNYSESGARQPRSCSLIIEYHSRKRSGGTSEARLAIQNSCCYRSREQGLHIAKGILKQVGSTYL